MAMQIDGAFVISLSCPFKEFLLLLPVPDLLLERYVTQHSVQPLNQSA